MTDLLNIDFRDDCLRILITRNGSVKYSKLVRDFPPVDSVSAKEVLALEINNSGIKKGRANIILPSEIVKSRASQLPAMNLEDTMRVIKRDLARELPGQSFSFGFRNIFKHTEAGSGKQHIVAEYVTASDLSK